MNQAIIRTAAKKPTLTIDVTVSPFLNTKQFENLESTVDGIVAAYMFSMGLSFIPASLITFAVK